MLSLLCTLAIASTSSSLEESLQDRRDARIENDVMAWVDQTSSGPEIVNVGVDDGIVVLDGYVRTDERREEVVRRARAMPGVRGVDAFTFDDPDRVTDAERRDRVESIETGDKSPRAWAMDAILSVPNLDARGIEVQRTVDDELQLTGYVRTVAQRNAAERAARSVTVLEIDNDLRLTR